MPSAFMALNCHNNYFQVSQSMAHIPGQTSKGIGVFALAFGFCALIYILVSLAGIALYGTATESNILINMGGQSAQNDVQAKLIRVVYLLIPLFNIPPLFITAKDSFIQMYAEYRYHAVSLRP